MSDQSSVVSIDHGREIRRARESTSNCRIVPASELLTVPVLPWSRILHWLDTGVEFDPHEAIQWLPFLVRKGGPLSFGLPVEDDAMCSEDPYSYPPESMIFVDPDQALQVKRTDRVLALLSDRETLCFRQLGRRGSQRVLEAMNPAHPVITGPFRVVGKVVARLVSDT